MNFRFNFERALQASACLLRLDRKKMSYLRLLKLLYIADREWLAETGESITGDRAYALKNGPVFSTVYDLIKGVGLRAGEWDDFIHTDGYTVELVADPGRGELSRAIVEKLTLVAERYHQVDDWELSERTHEFKEWADHFNGGTSLIPWQDILQAQNKSEMIAIVDRDETSRQVFEDVFRTRAMKAGDTFYIRDRGVDAHLWVVISDPDRDPARVVMVSMTTYENYKEDVCLLDVRDHPNVSRKTCIAYNEARMTTLENLTALFDGNHLISQAPVSEEVLRRVRAGVSRSTKIHYKYIVVLLDQQVID